MVGFQLGMPTTSRTVTSAAADGFRVFRGGGGVGRSVGPSVVAFGKFDGVHLGHRELLDRAAASARRLGLPSGAVTFERHPQEFLRRGPVPLALTSLTEKLRLLRAAGPRFVVLLPTDASVLTVTAAEFAQHTLSAVMSVRLVVVGLGFRFGHRAGGGVGTIRELSSVAGIDGVEVGTVEVAGGSVSSTRVRAALRDGDVQLAAMLLGRHFEATGLRHALGPSTERFVVPVHRAVPAPGRYAGRVSTDGMSSGAPAVVEVAAHEGRPLLTIEYCGRLPNVLARRARIAFHQPL